MSVNIGDILLNLWDQSGFAALFAGFSSGGWQNLVMIVIACVLLYLGIVKQFEPFCRPVCRIFLRRMAESGDDRHCLRTAVSGHRQAV